MITKKSNSHKRLSNLEPAGEIKAIDNINTIILCQSEFSNYFFFQHRKSSSCHLYSLWTKLEELRGLCWSGLDIYDCQFSAENTAQELSPSPGRQLDPRVCFGTCFKLHSDFWEPHGHLHWTRNCPCLEAYMWRGEGEGGPFSLRTSVASSMFLMEQRESLSLQNLPSPRSYHQWKPSLFSYRPTKWFCHLPLLYSSQRDSLQANTKNILLYFELFSLLSFAFSSSPVGLRSPGTSFYSAKSGLLCHCSEGDHIPGNYGAFHQTEENIGVIIGFWGIMEFRLHLNKAVFG